MTTTNHTQPSGEDAANGAIAALQRLENACDKIAALRTQEQYLSMVDGAQQDALLDLDSARMAARVVLASPVNGAMGKREARAIRLLEIAEPILEAAAVRKAVTIAAGDLLRQVRAFLPRAALTAEKVAEHAGPDALALGFIARLAGFKFRSRNPLYCWKKLTDLIGEAAQLIERIDRAGKGKE